MHKIRIAINGFGRIGRSAFKIALTKPELEVVAINDLTDPAILGHLLRYDSSYGPYEKTVSSDDKKEKANPMILSAGSIIVEGKRYPVFSEKDPGVLPNRPQREHDRNLGLCPWSRRKDILIQNVWESSPA